MVQGYYTLQEAAQLLDLPVEELKDMAKHGQIRSFQDRGTLRFRIQDIQELARKRGATSDPDLVLGDASLPKPKSSATPPSGTKKAPSSPKSPAKQESPSVFDFDVQGDNVNVGADLPTSAGGSKGKPSSKGKKPASPIPTGSDSDVRLVADGSDVTFSVPKEGAAKPLDSDVKISPDPLKPKTGMGQSAPSSGSKRASQLAIGSGAQAKTQPGSSGAKQSPRPGITPPVDSGVRLVPLDEDSDVKLLGSSDDVPLGESGTPAASDSSVRLEKVSLPPADSGEGDMNLTEEINLDEEIRKQQEKDKNQPATKLKAKSELKLPTNSPFELSESDLELPDELKADAGPHTPRGPQADKDSSDFDLAAQPEEGSSDFDLVPAANGSVDLESDSSDLSLEVGADSEQVVLNDSDTELTSSSSGISLDNPVDAGISLEEGDDASSDFDLSLEVEDTPRPSKSSPVDDSDSGFELSAEKTPKPKKAKAPAADSSEFELSLDSDADASLEEKSSDSSSEFELSLEGSGEGEAAGDSDSEFELTLDDSGNIAVEDEEAAPQVKSKKKKGGDEQDIFDTDFEVPNLEESDEQSAPDSELESSDFDLALDDSELAQEEESGSQVVALDEEDVETVADSDGDAAVVDDVDIEEESSDFQDLDADVQVDDDAVDVEVEEEIETRVKTRTVVKEKLIPAAPWGVFPVIFMLPCVIVMFLVGILGYELVQTTASAKAPGPMTKFIAVEVLGEQVTLKKQ